MSKAEHDPALVEHVARALALANGDDRADAVVAFFRNATTALDAARAWNAEHAGEIKRDILQNMHEAIDPVLQEIASEIDSAVPRLIKDRDEWKRRSDEFRRKLVALQIKEGKEGADGE